MKNQYSQKRSRRKLSFFSFVPENFFSSGLGVDCLSTHTERPSSRFLTSWVGQDGRKTSAIDCRYECAPSLLGIILERVVNIGLRHREDDSIDNVDDAVRGLNVWAYHARTINSDHLLLE